jgi:hypothetical protein
MAAVAAWAIPAAISVGMKIYDEFGKEDTDPIRKTSTRTKYQRKLDKYIYQGLKGHGPYKDLFGKFNKEKFEEGVSKPALEKFQTETLPELQEKFSGGNAVAGSGFRRANIKAKTNFQKELAGLMYNAQNDHEKNRLSGMQMLGGGNARLENIYENPGQTASGAAANNNSEYGKIIGDAVSGYLKDKKDNPPATTSTPAATSAAAGGV